MGRAAMAAQLARARGAVEGHPRPRSPLLDDPGAAAGVFIELSRLAVTLALPAHEVAAALLLVRTIIEQGGWVVLSHAELGQLIGCARKRACQASLRLRDMGLVAASPIENDQGGPGALRYRLGRVLRRAWAAYSSANGGVLKTPPIPLSETKGTSKLENTDNARGPARRFGQVGGESRDQGAERSRQPRTVGRSGSRSPPGGADPPQLEVLTAAIGAGRLSDIDRRTLLVLLNFAPSWLDVALEVAEFVGRTPSINAAIGAYVSWQVVGAMQDADCKVPRRLQHWQRSEADRIKARCPALPRFSDRQPEAWQKNDAPVPPPPDRRQAKRAQLEPGAVPGRFSLELLGGHKPSCYSMTGPGRPCNCQRE